MGYATVADMLDRFPYQDLAQLTDPAGQTVNTARLQVALDDASAEMDRYPAGVAALSAAERRRLCCDIALYRLMTLRPLGDMEDARKRYEDALAALRTAEEAGRTVRYFADRRRLSDEELEDYRP